MQNLYGLSYTIYENEHGKFFEVNKTNESFRQADLDTLSVNMIQSNSIPNLVPLVIEELNFNVSLHYNARNLISLQEFLVKGKITTPKLYQILYCVAEILDNSKNYMLDTEKYSLQDDVIFVNENGEDIHLVYLPLASIPGKVSVQMEFRNLLLTLMGFVSNFSGVGIPELTGLLNSGDFTVEKLRGLLATLVTQAGAGVAFETKPIQPVFDERFNGNAATDYQQDVAPGRSQGGEGNAVNIDQGDMQRATPQFGEESASGTAPNFAQSPTPNVESGKKRKKEKANNQPKAAKPPKAKSGSNKTSLYSVLVAIFLSAVIWKLYLDTPSEGYLLVSIGLTVLVLDLAFIVVAIVNRSEKVEGHAAVPSSASSPMQSPASTPMQRVDSTPMHSPVSTPSASQPVMSEQPESKKKKKKKQKAVQAPVVDAEPKELQRHQQPASPQPQNPDDYYRNLENHTMVIMSDNNPPEDGQTVMLTNQPQKDVAYLQFADPSVGKVEVTKEQFKVGRNSTVADIAVTSLGVSRVHLEIIKMGNDYGIKDLNSSNGTILNNQTLVPYEIYPIKDGDLVMFGDDEFLFKRGNQ